MSQRVGDEGLLDSRLIEKSPERASLLTFKNHPFAGLSAATLCPMIIPLSRSEERVDLLGVLAAVVIPNVGRFIGRGETEAAETEFANIQAAVHAMMVDNELAELANPVLLSTNDMGAFPDTSATADAGAGVKDKDVYGDDYEAADKNGYLLYQHDRQGGGTTGNLTNYVATQTTAYWYWVDSAGTVHQEEEAAS